VNGWRAQSGMCEFAGRWRASDRDEAKGGGGSQRGSDVSLDKKPAGGVVRPASGSSRWRSVSPFPGKTGAKKKHRVALLVNGRS